MLSATVNNKGFNKEIEEIIKKLQGKIKGIQVGYINDEKTDEKTDEKITIRQKAIFNEYGTETIPARSFIRSTKKENYKKWVKYFNKIYALYGKDKAFMEIVLMIEKDIKKKINSNIQPANAESTIKAKGSSGTLRASLEMRDSLQYEVIK